MTSLAEATAALGAAMASASFRSFAATFIKIENEAGELVPLELNEAQQVIDAEVRRQMELGRPVRLLILKGRQQGASTYCQAFLAWQALTRQGIRCHTVTHNLALTHDLFDKFDRARRELPEIVRPEVAPGGERGRRITFVDPLRSRARYDSAHDPQGVGRGGTVQAAHFTEVPQWAKPEETMQAALASIPDYPDTYVFVETTAKGASGWFYETWMDAQRALARGEEPEFVPVFVPWYLTKRYKRKRRAGEPQLTKRERAERDRYKLTNEQCYWYRDQRKKYGERVAEEFPFTWEEAFLSSGLPFFRRGIINQYREEAREPLKAGGFRMMAGGRKAKFMVDPYGPTRIFAMPEEDHRYVVAIDFASGRARDNSTIVVCDVDASAVVATYRDHPAAKKLPDEVLAEGVLLARTYNTALIVPERSGIGQALVDRLVNEIGYPHVYREEDPVAVKYHRGRRFGWATSNRTRSWLLEQMAQKVHTRSIEIPDLRILEEMQTFVYSDEDGQHAEAAQGQHDDMVMALAMAIQGFGSAPQPRKKSTPRRRSVISERTGY